MIDEPLPPLRWKADELDQYARIDAKPPAGAADLLRAAADRIDIMEQRYLPELPAGWRLIELGHYPRAGGWVARFSNDVTLRSSELIAGATPRQAFDAFTKHLAGEAKESGA